MPLYEYTCLQCHRRFSVLVGMTAQDDSETCPHCGHAQAARRISRFSKGRTEDERLDSLANPDMIGDMDDPKTMRRWAKEMGSEMGEDLGDEFDEYLESAEEDEGDGASSPSPLEP